MCEVLTIQIERPFSAAQVLGNYMIGQLTAAATSSAAAKKEQDVAIAKLESAKAEYCHVTDSLQGIIDKLGNLYAKVVAEHKEEIAKLSVEIARKVLVAKVDNGDYEIEGIIQEAIKSAPTRQDVQVYLNPADLEKLELLQQDGDGGGLTGVELIGDPAIGLAECRLETPKGAVASCIEDHLDRIGRALQGVG